MQKKIKKKTYTSFRLESKIVIFKKFYWGEIPFDDVVFEKKFNFVKEVQEKYYSGNILCREKAQWRKSLWYFLLYVYLEYKCIQNNTI